MHRQGVVQAILEIPSKVTKLVFGKNCYNIFKENTKKLSPDNHQKMMGILRAIKLMPEEPVKTSGKSSGNTNITIKYIFKRVCNFI
mgnify:CR=1 FL=1